MRKRIVVFGSAQLEEQDSRYEETLAIGRLIGKAGWDVVCGGYRGVMEAVCHGCHLEGGQCFGVGLQVFPYAPNPYINDFVAVKNFGERLEQFAQKSQVSLALYGGLGTVTEVMYFWDSMRAGVLPPAPILLYGSHWQRLLEALHQEFIIQPNAFHYLSMLDSKDELAVFLQTFHGQSEVC